MSNTTDPSEPIDSPGSALDEALNVFDSADSKETVIYLCIAILALIGIGLALKAIFWLSDTFRYPGWSIWSVRTRQTLAIMWTTSWVSLAVELFFLLSAIFSVATFVYVTILIATKVPEGATRQNILRIPWLYWTEFVLTILCGAHLMFRLYTARNGLYAILDPSIVLEVIAGIPLLTSPFRGQFAWNFQYLRIIRLHHALSFLSHHPSTAFSGKSYLLMSYIFSTICMIFGAGGFFFVLENKYFNESGVIRDMVDAMYYVIITVSTTGYGDISPKTVLGRIGAIMLALCALIYIPLRVAELVGILQISTSGVVKKPGGHFLVCASCASDFETFVEEFYHPDRTWTDVTLALMAPNSEVEAALQPLVKSSGNEVRLQALQGSLSNPSDYGYYHLDQAAGVVLMADKNKGSAGDAITLVTAMSLVQRFPLLPLYVQLQSSASKHTALARGISNTICIQELRKGILIQNSLHPGFAPLILNLMRSSCTASSPVSQSSNLWLNEYRRGASNEFYSHAPLIDFQGLSFAETALYLCKKYGIILIGVIAKTERLVAKKKSKRDLDSSNSSTKDTSTENSTSSNVAHSTRAAVRRSLHHSDKNERVTFDRHRRSLQDSIDAGDRISIDLRPGTHQSILHSMINPEDFELVIDWDLKLNPGSDFLIQDGFQGLVLAQDDDAVQSIACDDISLLQRISTQVATWQHLDPSMRNRHLKRTISTSSAAHTLGHPYEYDATGSSDSSSEDSSDEDTQTRKSTNASNKAESGPGKGSDGRKKAGQASLHHGVEVLGTEKRKMKKKRSERYGVQSAAPSQDQSSNMVDLSKESSVKVAREIKEGYELVRKFPLNLDECTLQTTVGKLKDHILVVGDWEEDMYELVLGFRSKVLSKHGSCRPLVFLGPNSPHPLVWQRVCVFRDINIVIGSQLDSSDLVRAGAQAAYSVLVLSSGEPTSDHPTLADSKNLTTFLILERLTRSHVTIELRSAESLQLLLKGHAPLYRKKPSQKDPSRAAFDSAKASYKEIAKIETTANPYFASGNIFVTSFLDSLISLAYYNEQIVGVLNLFTSPDAFQSIPVSAIIEAYPELVEPPKKQKKSKRATKTSLTPSAHEQNSTEMQSLDQTELDATSPHSSTQDVTFYKVFHLLLKHSTAIILAVKRYHDTTTRPYVVTAPDPAMILSPEDICLILDSNHLGALSSDHPQPESSISTSNVSMLQVPRLK